MVSSASQASSSQRAASSSLSKRAKARIVVTRVSVRGAASSSGLRGFRRRRPAAGAPTFCRTRTLSEASGSSPRAR
jgi:hypothetical protein